MHPNNRNKDPYQFKYLRKANPKLSPYILDTDRGIQTVDFTNSDAVLELNRAIMLSDYSLNAYELPSGYLCPAVPGRADYLLYLKDFINKEQAHGLDIGTGANFIYPLLAASLFKWKMKGVDTDKNAIKNASLLIENNTHLKGFLTAAHQSTPAHIFEGILLPGEKYDFTMCNPPFYSSEKEAFKATKDKSKGLKLKEVTRNFKGQSNELWCNGGEALFVKRMIKESVKFKSQVGWFTTLISKNENLPKLKKQLEKLNSVYQTVDMSQGNKKSRFLAWKFKE
ncbi:23S rRNA (adenine(1618)-N(6))-methyltransferase RlmF [Dokdonia sp. Hel_I_53]|uniref:23S rRNA (adenine(1618)-N(6))-methyltransferase RlmF n=1 Tax=Dokdonia sp. Hel_I_53 TaxID=1566287 RepID=UPI00119A62C8|nr:23S rRNA (adenine(1618)-N(6))-methyltransferase RlmF [Dokdonia sp. Hel_I_53]TVZ51433.1 23S rRNA (adenine1618-N6)-methyltransferase [Dokdonia sp. Hel_I_53]